MVQYAQNQLLLNYALFIGTEGVLFLFVLFPPIFSLSPPVYSTFFLFRIFRPF